MQCFKCKSFVHIGNTAETGCGLCSFNSSFFPVHKDDKCHLQPGELRCIDCDRFGNDTACMACQAEDSAYHNGHLCAGFIDAHETIITNALLIWRMRGEDYHTKIQEILDKVDTAELPGAPREDK